ncbi:hypothetical protein GDO78_008675 [Eleutherodactylus coqui]|uniref:Uncharacterized protein n=1 Tax=Eleutherodactylus coqui TaxID=57060 RepID=A0A8J6FCT0_ELECQ|nr:hypothetical protein GDO78_008675 [Eleutherodactylus coqui]
MYTNDFLTVWWARSDFTNRPKNQKQRGCLTKNSSGESGHAHRYVAFSTVPELLKITFHIVFRTKGQYWLHVWKSYFMTDSILCMV